MEVRWRGWWSRQFCFVFPLFPRSVFSELGVGGVLIRL
jgi:hypothetical protein